MVFTTSYNCVHEEDMVFTIILFQFQCMTGACSWLPDLRCTVRLRLKPNNTVVTMVAEHSGTMWLVPNIS